MDAASGSRAMESWLALIPDWSINIIACYLYLHKYSHWSCSGLLGVSDWDGKKHYFASVNLKILISSLQGTAKFKRNTTKIFQMQLNTCTVNGLIFLGYQFSLFSWRVQSTNSSTHKIVIFCICYEGKYYGHKFLTPWMHHFSSIQENWYPRK